MQSRRGVLLALVVLALALTTSVAFNQDRIIYKWSPLWFNSHYRSPNLYKRFRDEPIEKWSPTYFGSTGISSQQKKDGSSCGRENSICAFFSEVTGRFMVVRCCGSLECVFTGSSHTCTDPKTRIVDAEEPETINY